MNKNSNEIRKVPNGRNIPNLRFPEFEGEWEEKSFKELTKINQGLQIAISERYTEKVKGGYFYITNEFLKAGNTKKYYIKNPPKSVLCSENDVLMTRTGNTGMVVTGVSGAFHNNFFKIKFNDESLDKDFLVHFLKSHKIQCLILRLAGTSTIPDLNHSDFYRITIVKPQLFEQKKIASFINLLNSSISTQNKIIEDYRTLKKGVMQKIFKQEIRFKDENGKEFPKWKKENLGELADVTKGKQLNKEELTGEGIFPCQNGGIEPSGYTEDFNTSENTITISEGGNSCGYVNYMTTKFWCGGHCYSILNIKEKVSNLFLYQYLKYNQNQIMRLRVGSGLPNIQKRDIVNFKVLIPCFKEQQKIAATLSGIDQKITLEEGHLDKLKAQKKYLLQNMFI